MAKDVQDMTRTELIAHIRDLERTIEGGAMRRVREDLRVYQEQAQAQHEQLIEAQKDLTEACDRFMSLYDAAPVAFATLDRNGVIEQINQTGLALLRLDQKKVLKRPLVVFVASEDRQLFLSHISQCRKADHPCVVELHLNVRGVGPVLVQLATRPAPRPRLGGICYLTAITDLTQLRAAEVERQRLVLQEQVSHASSLAKDHFLAVLSHELRTPLSPVVATLAMLQDKPGLDSETREHLEMIRRNVLLEARLIDDLLDVTRIARGKLEMNRERTDLVAVIDRAIEVCMPDMHARGVHFDIQHCDGPHFLDADPVRLQQVIWNLLKNAIKFTPRGGRIYLRCRREDDQAIVDVHDTGKGIDPEVMPRLFNAFEQGDRQTTRQFGGLGLGLAISKAISEMHSGTLSAYSAGPGHGATFTLKLPVLPVSAPAQPAAPVPAPAQPAAAPATGAPGQPSAPAPSVRRTPARPLRILLVEDHPDTARVMKRLLSAQGHQVETASDIASAFDLAREHPFDLMLSDLGLPDGSGLDLMRQIRASGLKLPSIALSGYGQEQDVQQSHEAGFVAHLTKPVNLPKLEAAIANAIGQRPA